MPETIPTHRGIFGWQCQEAELHLLRECDIQFWNGKPCGMDWLGAVPQAGDWMLRVEPRMVDLCDEYGIEAANYGNALDDVGRTLAKTGAGVVSLSTGWVDDQGGSIYAILRGGNWEGVHVHEAKCGVEWCKGRVWVRTYDKFGDHNFWREKCNKCKERDK